MTGVARSRWESTWVPLWIAAFVAFVFVPTLWFTQVGLDDHWLWADDSPLRHLSGETMRHIFFELNARARHDIGTEYLPVRDILVAVDMAMWGESYRGPHVTQLVLYLITIVALGRLLIRLGLRADIAWIATLLWAVHPLHVEPVAWISERKGILAGLFVVATGHAWVRFRTGGSARWIAIAALTAIAAVWSKAPAMFAPLAFAALDLLVLPRGRRRWIAFGCVGAAVALAALPVLYVARGAGVVDNELVTAIDNRAFAALGALGHYTLGFVGARSPSVAYPMHTAGASVLDLAIGAVAIIVGIALATRPGPSLVWRRAMVAWAAIWFIPISHLVTRIHITVADRYVYLWILAPCVGIAALLSYLRGPVRLAAICALVAGLAVQSFRAQEAWTGTMALSARAFESNPDDTRAALNYSNQLFTIGRVEDALAVLDRCLETNRDEPYLLAYRASILDAVQRSEEALASSTRAAASGHASVMHEHAGRLSDLKRYAEALPFAERAARRRPENPEYRWRWVFLLGKLGRFDEAVAICRELQHRFPGSATEIVLARLYAEWRRADDVELHLALAQLFGASRNAIAKVRADLASPVD